MPSIDKSQAVAAPRTDPGTGICGNFTHFMQPQTPLVDKAGAVMKLNLPMGDPSIIGRTARIFDNINFRNGQPGTSGDFAPPNFRKDVFPWSIDPLASPMGTLQNGGDTNLALRLRGYFNVPSTLTGKTISFGLNCDDFCSLNIGTTPVIPVADERISARVIRQVSFKDPGLYPLELVYYQNGSQAYLEWSRTDTAVAECPGDICSTSLTDMAMYMSQFKLVAREELYSSIIGSNPGCQECGAPGMLPCSKGNYCGDGLCQSCVSPQHCGAECVMCPASMSLCSMGKCVQCVADDQCPVGQTCDIPNGKCNPPTPCTTVKDCPAGQECDSADHMCHNPPKPCTDATMCGAGQICENHFCKTPPKPCNMDSDCGDTAHYYCDVAEHICKLKLTQGYYGGTAGCSMSQGRGQSQGTAGMLAFMGLLVAGLVARSRRRLATAGVPVSARNRMGLRRAAWLLPVFFFLRPRA